MLHKSRCLATCATVLLMPLPMPLSLLGALLQAPVTLARSSAFRPAVL